MSGKEGHILIVDDSPDDIQFLMENLKYKYSVIPTTSGEKALDIAANDPQPDAILLDVEMPGMNGYETCRLLKENPETQDINVIFVSAHDTTEEKMEGYEAGGSDYVIKPLNPDELLQKVDVAVKNRRTHNEILEEKENILSGFMEVLTSSGEQGVVIEFLRKSFTVNSPQELADLLVDAVSNYTLNSTIQIRTGIDEVHASSNKPIAPLEMELLKRLKSSGRIIEHNSRLIVNYGDVSLLVKNLPQDDIVRGRLRDHLALLVEGASSRYVSIKLAQMEEGRKRKLLSLIKNSLIELEEIKKLQKDHEAESMHIMNNMLQNLEKSFMSWGLTEDQEENLLEIVESGIYKTMDHFDDGIKFDKRFEEVIKRFADLAK